MFTYQKFLIRDNDHFEAYNYPVLEHNLSEIVQQLQPFPGNDKTTILLDFLKERTMPEAASGSNQKIAGIIREKAGSMEGLQNLFTSSRENAVFTKELEDFIRQQLQSSTTTSIH